MRKLFGKIDLTWKKLILFALVMGVYTAVVAMIPQLLYTSFHTIAVTLEVWIPIGIFIIMNSKSNTDAALKCFVFFLISQPLVYLLQVPFSSMGWGLFRYYPFWFKWTVACLPMGFIGYFIKKDKWWGYLILFPMIVETALSYAQYLKYFTFSRPFYLLICIFCAAMMILYPNVLFTGKKVRITGTVISVLAVVVITAMTFMKPYVYPIDLFSVCGEEITEEYEISLADNRYGDVSIQYMDLGDEDICLVHIDAKKAGKTELIVKTPAGEIKTYDMDIQMDTYEISEK